MASVRRLAAIMFTDMVGSTAAAQVNEAQALALRDEQEALVRPLFAAHQGREVKSLGDGFLAEFDSALRAVQCATDIMEHLRARNQRPGVTAIRLRIGIHLGDVEERAGDIHGDAVNVASRIGPFAGAGGVCVSGAVYDQVRNKVSDRFERLPATPLKNVLVPVDVYRLILPWEVATPVAREDSPRRLAVLPLANISPDPKDEYFAEGLTEELIGVLSQLRDLRVIARTSVSQYRSTPKPVNQIGAELGVRSVLEGSVRKAGNQLRISLQLIDVESQAPTWAQTYDRELDDVFATQTEIARHVAEAFRLKIRPAEESRLEARSSIRPNSYLAYLRGRTYLYDNSEEAARSAKTEFENAIAMDETNAAAYAGLSDAEWLLGWWYVFPRPPGLSGRRRSLVLRALELDPNLAEAHASLAGCLWFDYDYAAAEKEVRLAIALSPSYATAHQKYAGILADENRIDEALAEWSLAEQADPRSPAIIQGHANLLIELRRMDSARALLDRLKEVGSSGFGNSATLANYHSALGDFAATLAEVEAVQRMVPGHPVNTFGFAEYHATRGDRERAHALVLELEALYPEGKTFAQLIAEVYARLDDLEACFRWLRTAVTDHSIEVSRWRIEPSFAKVRHDPRFAEILRGLRLG